MSEVIAIDNIDTIRCQWETKVYRGGKCNNEAFCL